nr:Ig-like domain-containing protein [Steroidobacteraceae bacterium]
PAPAPSRAGTPLAIDQSNAEDVLASAAAVAESLLQLGQFGVDFARLGTQRATATFTTPCRGGGAADLSLVDPDGNRVPTAGDTLRVALRRCYAQSIDDFASGELTYTLVAPAAGASEAYAGTLAFGPGFLVGDPQGPRIEVAGSLRVEWRAQPLGSELQLTASAANDLALTLVAGADRATERVRGPQLSKAIDFATARTRNRFGFALESELLQGRIDVDTPTDFSAFLGAYPDAGLLRVSGAGSNRGEASPGRNNAAGQDVLLSTVAVATGATTWTRTVPWTDLVEGFLWWEPAIGVASPGAGYRTSARPLQPGFAALYRAPIGLVPVNPEIVLQFTLPLSSAETYAFRLVPLTGTVAPGAIVATTTRVAGTRLVIKPARQLSHGTPYSLEKLSGRYIAQGGTTELNQFFDPVTTRNDLVATVAATPVFGLAGATVALDASGSTSADGPIQRFAWRQLFGTPATLAGAAAANASATLNRGPAAVETTQFEVTVENAFGESDTALVSLEQINDQARTQLLYVRGSAGYTPFDGRRQIRTPANGQFSISPFLGGLRLFHMSAGSSSSIDAAGADDLPLAVGVYENATDVRPVLQRPPLLRVSTDNIGCSGPGRFEVHDVAYGTGGELTRLALDFETRCSRPDGSTSPPLFGSIRINSARPIRE